MKLPSISALGVLVVFVSAMMIYALSQSQTRSEVSNAEASAPDLGVSSMGAPRVLDRAALTETWRQFRGHQSHGTTERVDLPIEWSKDQNVLWETELPGRGASTPIAHYQRVFVTSSSGYGDAFESQGGVRYLKHHVACLDAYTGKMLWRRDIVGSKLTQGLNQEVLQHGFASSSPATDGSNVYAFFGASGVFAFNAHGQQLWHADVGFEHNRFGSAASPIIYKNALIVNASAESESVYALDLKDGHGLWRIEGVKDSYSTPVVATNSTGKVELIIQDAGRVRGFDILSGTELWQFDGPEGYASSTPFVEKGVCFFTAGTSRTLSAIRIGGSGNVTKTHKLWSVNNTSRHTTPIYLTGNVYTLSESGVFKCLSAVDGKLLAARRVPVSGRVYSSPVLAGPYFYLPTGGNRFFVCRANEDLELVRDNEIDRQEIVNASLCPSANSLLIRSENRLHCAVRTSRRTRTNPVSDDQEMINVGPRFDLDPNTEQIKKYNQFLDRDPRVQAAAILEDMPSELSYPERLKAQELLATINSGLTDLRKRQRECYWKKLKYIDYTRPMLINALSKIELETLDEVKSIQTQIAKELERSAVAVQ